MYSSYQIIQSNGECQSLEKINLAEYKVLTDYVNSDSSIKYNIKPKTTFTTVKNTGMWKIPVAKIREILDWKYVKQDVEVLMVSDMLSQHLIREQKLFKIKDYIDPKGNKYEEAYIYKNMIPYYIIEGKSVDTSSIYITLVTQHLFIDQKLNIKNFEEVSFGDAYYNASNVFIKEVYNKIKEFKDKGLPVYTPIYLFKYDQNFQANEESGTLLKLNFPGKAMQTVVHPYQLLLDISKNRGYAKNNSNITLINYFKKFAHVSLRQRW